MTDREMLELAAHAAGIEVAWNNYWEMLYTTDLCVNRDWNPLTDDGDALRLAIKLGIEYRFRVDQGNCVVAEQSESLRSRFGLRPKWVIVQYGPDEMACDVEVATRRAIVRAAAEIALATPVQPKESTKEKN